MNSNLRLLIDQAEHAVPRDERERLVLTHFPLIQHVARECHIRLTDELLSIATETLMRAAAMFDPAKGVKFKTYAFQALWRELTRPKKKRQITTVRLADHENRSESGTAVNGPLAVTPDPLPALIAAEHNRRLARRLLLRMNRRDRQVIKAWLWDGKTQEEIGAELGVGKSRAQQLVARGLAKARGRLTLEDVA